MKKDFLKKIISLFLVLSFSFSQFFTVSVVYAQSPGVNKTINGSYSETAGYNQNETGTFGNVSGYISGLAPAITQLPLCKGKIKGTIQKLFTGSGAKSALSGITDNKQPNIHASDSSVEDFAEETTERQNEIDSILVVDKDGNKKLDDVQKRLNVIESNTSQTLENDTCLKSIGRMIIKMLLQKITVSTVAWIQNGFEGGPAFLTNPGEFFGDIAKNEIISFGLEISSPNCEATITGNLGQVDFDSNFDNLSEDCLSPFAKSWLKSQVEFFDKRFAEHARYSLNELIASTTPQYTAFDFSSDFSMGGWDAWSYMTQVPANNPIGFNYLAMEELSTRLEGTSKSTAERTTESLEQGNGFLGDERCVYPKGLTREEHNNALRAGVKEMKPVPVDSVDPLTGVRKTTIKQVPTGRIVGTCERWEYVTTGKMIAEAATEAMKYPQNNLLMAEDLNDAIAAILDALLSQFSTQLMQKGFANMSRAGSNGQFFLNQEPYTKAGYQLTNAEKDYHPSTMSPWLQRNLDFNIRTDISQAFLDTQRIYVQKLKEYNDALKQLVRTTYQLDYCIPGPTPDWEQRARQEIARVSREIPSTPGSDTIGIVKGLLTLLKGINLSFDIKPAGIGLGVSLNVGNIAEGVMTTLGNGLPEEIMTRYYYTTVLRSITRIQVAPSNQIGSKGDVINILDGIVDAYNKALKATYTKDKMPAVTKIAEGEYYKVPGYNALIEENEIEITLKSATITQLLELKKELEEKYPEIKNWKYLEDQEFELDFEIDKDLLSKFNRLSMNFVDGDAIAEVDRMLKQAIDHEKYVYEVLFEGPDGCDRNLNQSLENEAYRRLYPTELFVPYNGKFYGQSESYLECKAPYILEGNSCVVKLPECGPEEYLIGNYCQNASLVDPGVYNPLLCGEGFYFNTFTKTCMAMSADLEYNDSYDQYLDQFVLEETEEEYQANQNEVDVWVDNYETYLDSIVEPTIRTKTGKPEGFLIYGYVESDRKPGPGQKDNQLIKIPKGILEVNKQCAVLTFGPHAKSAAKRQLRAAKKDCRKNYKGEEERECKMEAERTNKEILLSAGLADEQLRRMCDFRKESRDSILPFEKFMNIY